MQKKSFKIITFTLIISIFIFSCMCAMAARCGPYKVEVWDLHMVELTDEENGAYFRKLESGNYAFGYITLKNGERVSAYMECSWDEITVREMYSFGEDDILFVSDSALDMGDNTLTCTVSNVSEDIELGFTELVLQITQLTEFSEINPYELTDGGWYDENSAFMLNYYYDQPIFLRSLTSYCIDDNGYISYGQYYFKWMEGGFEIFEGDMCVASGTYFFDALEFELTLTLESDEIFGANKPFASYPDLILYTDWVQYHPNYFAY